MIMKIIELEKLDKTIFKLYEYFEYTNQMIDTLIDQGFDNTQAYEHILFMRNKLRCCDVCNKDKHC